MNLSHKILKHTQRICKHKFLVMEYCFACGLYKQGILHDLSKFSPTEYIESIKFYDGTPVSPIERAKQSQGFSLAWMHHKGHNKHHFEYWIDSSYTSHKPEVQAYKIPFEYVLEMVCDYLAAGQIYMGDEFTLEEEFEWWEAKKQRCMMHNVTKEMVTWYFSMMKACGIMPVLKNRFLHKMQKYNYDSSKNHLEIF